VQDKYVQDNEDSVTGSGRKWREVKKNSEASDDTENSILTRNVPEHVLKQASAMRELLRKGQGNRKPNAD